MPLYELCVALRTKIEEDGDQTIKDKIEGLIGQNGGKLKNIDELGLRKLTYEVNGEEEGRFMRAVVDIDSALVQELVRGLRAEDGILRLMLVKARTPEQISPDESSRENEENKNVSQQGNFDR